jgi:hypothetical protein
MEQTGNSSYTYRSWSRRVTPHTLTDHGADG